MRVAIASGKGGTGKTTFATNLALVLAEQGVAVRLLDCDVEEPDCHLFLRPVFESNEPVTVRVPQIDFDACTVCGACAEACQYGALAVAGATVLTFAELCHSCGGCSLVCPAGAIREVERVVGQVEIAVAMPTWPDPGPRFPLVRGTLNVGEPKATPVVAAVSRQANGAGADEVVLIDASPGTSCPTIEALRDADLGVLVTEPTPFGLHDLELAVAMARVIDLPAVVAINRAGIGDDRVGAFCAREGIEVVAEIPDDRRIAVAYSCGELAALTVEGAREAFVDAWDRIEDAVRTCSRAGRS